MATSTTIHGRSTRNAPVAAAASISVLRIPRFSAAVFIVSMAAGGSSGIRLGASAAFSATLAIAVTAGTPTVRLSPIVLIASPRATAPLPAAYEILGRRGHRPANGDDVRVERDERVIRAVALVRADAFVAAEARLHLVDLHDVAFPRLATRDDDDVARLRVLPCVDADVRVAAREQSPVADRERRAALGPGQRLGCGFPLVGIGAGQIREVEPSAVEGFEHERSAHGGRAIGDLVALDLWKAEQAEPTRRRTSDDRVGALAGYLVLSDPASMNFEPERHRRCRHVSPPLCRIEATNKKGRRDPVSVCFTDATRVFRQRARLRTGNTCKLE